MDGYDPQGIGGLVGATALVESGDREMTGVVAEVGGGTLCVDCDEDPPEGCVGQAVVSVFAPDALYRITGTCSTSGRRVTVGPGAPVERIQRRKWPRRRLDMPVTLCPVAEGTRVEGIPGRTVDIGVGGLCVETLRPVEGEGEPMVILSLPDGTSIVSSAVTVGAEDLGDGWRYRLAFRHLDAHDAGKLASLTSESE
jgi:hypothetical protein